MPCYQTNTISVAIQCADKDLLGQAIKNLGLTYNRSGDVFYLGGMIIGTNMASVEAGYQYLLNEIKREYSKETIKKTMKKKRWTGSWKSTKTGTKIKLKKY